jgi:hypothetical protein
MVEISAVQVDEILDKMYQYSKTNFGIKNGEDFPLIVKALINSEKFKGIIQAIGIVSLLGTILMPKDLGSQSIDEKMKFVEELPIRDSLVDMFYAGYKLGLAVAEINKLNEMK